jgi:hypothetical protein
MNRLCKNCANLGEQVLYDFYKCDACPTILTQKDRLRNFCKDWEEKDD